MAQAQLARRWCFTWNNYDDDYMNKLNEMDCKYMIVGEEVGASGTKHLQGYAVFSGNKRLSGVKKDLPAAHWEIAKGTTQQNIDYCSKEGHQTQFGVVPKSKKELGEDEQTRWKNIIAMAKAGTLEENEPKVYFQNYRTCESLKTTWQVAPEIVRTIKVFWGVTGTGKSRTAWDQAGIDAFPKDPRTKFWNGYNEQKNVVIDEFRGGIDISHMLRWTDRYPNIVEVKGSSRPLLAENIWITSNLHPKDWYPELDDASRDALMRRLDVTQFHGFLNKT